ncbi:hypothetical protein [Paenibacillus pini]|uniref:hypothetical protein n=1 Tax=Paenibacillus pini TaxID=669461 RepID=UPI00056D33A9|nr:hypothetical protein [Paenibacillus pini]
MGILIGIIITVVLLVNLILSYKEGKDERWKQIINRPLNYAFTLLILGYALSPFCDQDLNAYKSYYNYLFAGVLVVYIALLLIERRRLS